MWVEGNDIAVGELNSITEGIWTWQVSITSRDFVESLSEWDQNKINFLSGIEFNENEALKAISVAISGLEEMRSC